MLNINSAKMIANGIGNTICTLSSNVNYYLNIMNVTNNTEDIQTRSSAIPESNGNDSCPMKKGKPFVTNYMNNKLDELTDEDLECFNCF